jgi:ubiquitin carboxyl-terminal hydrolase 6/32
VKSQKVVNFPFDQFDPTPYLASVPQETILRHKELLEMKARNIRNVDCNDEINEFDKENDIINDHDNHTCDVIKENEDDDSEVSPVRSHSHQSVKPNRRKRLESTSLTKTPIVDGEFIDYNNHKLKPQTDPFDLKYKLYAVVVNQI